MFGKQLRKFFAAFTAIFWADKSKFLMSIFASFWAVQHIACAYGPDEPLCEDDCYDPAWNCTPVFDVSKMSRVGYSDCENKIADLAEYIEDCKNPYDDIQVVERDEFAGPGIMDSAYVEGMPVDCSYSTQSSSMKLIDSYTLTCFVDHMRMENAFTGYMCGDTYVSVEEGNKRKGEKNNWIMHHTR